MKRPFRMYLSEYREKAGFSVRKLSILCGISHQHYLRIEDGRIGGNVSFKVMGAISNALGVPMSEVYVQEMRYQEKIQDEISPH